MRDLQIEGPMNERVVRRAMWQEVGGQLSENELLRRAQMMERVRWARMEELTLLIAVPLLTVLMVWEVLR